MGKIFPQLALANLGSVKTEAYFFTYIAAAMYYTGTRTVRSPRSHCRSLHLLSF